MHTDAAEQVFRDRSSVLSTGPVIIRASPETLRANIPVELQQIRQWLPWKLEMRGDKARKVPVGRNLRNVDSGDRAHWLSFEDSLRLLERQTDITGVGFVLSADDGIVAVDIDWKNCVGLGCGEIPAFAVHRHGRLCGVQPVDSGRPFDRPGGRAVFVRLTEA